MPKLTRHYHRFLIDGIEDDMFSEIMHSHDGGDRGHEHDIILSAGYVKIEQPLAP